MIGKNSSQEKFYITISLPTLVSPKMDILESEREDLAT